MTDDARFDPTAPAVSIVIATFNRPQALAFAIRSVLAQDFRDWELIVIGDHCTESTDAAVAGFGDSRIRYVNLPLRYGDQSGPNNVGIARARGCIIAFLNQDDLWFPDHLSTAVAPLEAGGADMVVARAALIRSTAPLDEPPDTAPWFVEPSGGGRHGAFDPATTDTPASCMVVRTAAARAVAPWTPLAQCYCNSSQLWSYRIWRQGFRIEILPHLTVIKIGSILRLGSYRSDDTTEQRYFEALLKEPASLRSLLHDRVRNPRAAWKRFAWHAAHAVMRLAARCGIPPHEMLWLLLMRRCGQMMRLLYRLRGLPPPSPQ